jgi:DNA-binding CsgD family transcriptional regulator
LERLATRDLRTLLDFLRDVYAVQNLNDFLRHVVSGLGTVVPSDSTSYNEVNLRLQRNTFVADPPDAFTFPDHQRIFQHHIPEHPLIAHFGRTGDAEVIVQREGKALVVRLWRDAGHCFLLLEERATAPPQPQGLERLGLSRREAEVLSWMAEGKTNREIGTILAASARTVGKHVEHILQKLGVETRTAAAARALQAWHQLP